MVCNFSLSHYQECLVLAKAQRIEIVHDVDFPPNNVLQIAEMEHALGYRTKYFIRLHAKLYNALSEEHLAIFKLLAERYGHELGLHFEPFFYQNGDMQAAIRQEALLLEKVLGQPISYMSIHSPLKAGGIDARVVLPGMRYYCHDSEYYKGKKYLSDSGGRWREGCVCGHLGKHEQILLLTHPNWWYRETPSENY